MSVSADDLDRDPLRLPVTFLLFRAKSSSGEIGSCAGMETNGQICRASAAGCGGLCWPLSLCLTFGTIVAVPFRSQCAGRQAKGV